MTAIVLLIAGTASAQQINLNLSSYGIKGGATIANATGVEDSNWKPSVYFGVFAGYDINELVTITGEVVYSRQGLLHNETANSVRTEQKIRANYINVPLLLQIHLADKFTLDLGPQVGFLVAAKNNVRQTANGESVEQTVDMYDGNEKLDFSIAMGFSYDLGNNAFMQARYNMGMTDTAKDNASTNKIKNQVFQVGMGYRF